MKNTGTAKMAKDWLAREATQPRERSGENAKRGMEKNDGKAGDYVQHVNKYEPTPTDCRPPMSQ